MGAGSAKGVNEVEEEDMDAENDRFSIISGGSPAAAPKLPKSKSQEGVEVRTSIRDKIEALGAESEDDEPLPKSGDEGERKEDERKKGLFGFSRKKSEDEKTNAFVHEDGGDETKRSIKRESSKGFRFFKFKKEGKKISEEKDEKLDQEIKDLQQAFDSLGIVGSNVWEENKRDNISSKKSQSADDIRELEPMRNRLNQKRRFSRPANAGGSVRKRPEGMISSSEGGKRRTFKYSWEKENVIASPVQTEDWKYEAISIKGFDVNKFKEANKEGSVIMSGSDSDGINSERWGSPLLSGTEIGTKSPPLTYDPAEQKLLASIEREFV